MKLKIKNAFKYSQEQILSLIILTLIILFYTQNILSIFIFLGIIIIPFISNLISPFN